MGVMFQDNLFSAKQFGFIVLQLLRVIDEWTETLDKDGCVDVMCTGNLKLFHIEGF